LFSYFLLYRHLKVLVEEVDHILVSLGVLLLALLGLELYRQLPVKQDKMDGNLRHLEQQSIRERTMGMA
jgi:hypothetical protein